jgi:hypothetical protein
VARADDEAGGDSASSPAQKKTMESMATRPREVLAGHFPYSKMARLEKQTAAF